MSEYILVVGEGSAKAAARFGRAEERGVPSGVGPPEGSQGVLRGEGFAAAQVPPDGMREGRRILRTPHLVVAASASLFYLDDLLRALGIQNVAARVPDAPELIAAAWVKWGEECVHRIEGDWSFALLDFRTRSLFCARDPYGTRTLFHAHTQHGFVASSCAESILALGGDRFRLSREGVIRVLSGRDGDGSVTVWDGLKELPAGHSLAGPADASLRRSRFWSMQFDQTAAALSEEDAVQQTRELLAAACRERVPDSGAAVAMSGGWDSTALFGSLMADGGAGRGPVSVVTLKFPEGDPGNEDAYVNAVLERWGASATWVDTQQVPVTGPHFDASLADPLPHLHHFHGINRALAQAAANDGRGVLLSGAAGDLLFDVDPRFLADLLRSGRWAELRREWRARGFSGWELFKELCVRPNIPDPLFDLKARLQGRRRIVHPLGLARPAWFTDAAWQDETILEQDRASHRELMALARDRFGPSVTSGVRWLGLAHPVLHRVTSDLDRVNRAAGVQFRIPYLDDRLVRFALSRPRRDTVRGGETKILLRRAMAGALPHEVLAPRAHRTGTTDRYFYRSMSVEGPALMERLGSAAGALAELGLIEPVPLRVAIDRIRSGRPAPDLALFRTLHLGLWLDTCEKYGPNTEFGA